jgi:hypothetical protein
LRALKFKFTAFLEQRVKFDFCSCLVLNTKILKFDAAACSFFKKVKFSQLPQIFFQLRSFFPAAVKFAAA